MSSPFSSGSQDDVLDSPISNSSGDSLTDSPLQDMFGDEPLNQVVSDPSTFADVIRLQCSKCRFTYEGRGALQKCPRCGADKEFLIDL